MLLYLAAVFSHHASARDAEPAGTEPDRTHVRPMDVGGTFTGGMFPRLDSRRRGEGDLELVVDRLPFGIRGGSMPGDDVAALGLTTTRTPKSGASTVRLSGLWALDRVGEAGIASDGSDVNLLGLFAEGEFSWGLLTVGVARTFAAGHRGEGADGGVGWPTHPTGDDGAVRANPFRRADPVRRPHDSGSRLAIGYSTEIGLRRDILYASGYWSDGDFRRLSSGRSSTPGPVGPFFSDVGTGGHRPDVRSGRLDSAGFAVGMQTFFADEAANWAVELGYRQHLDDGYPGPGDTGGTALTTRAQYRFAERLLLRLDAYYDINGSDSKNRRVGDTEIAGDSSALRLELRVSF